MPFFRDLPDPSIKPRSPSFQAGTLPSDPPGKPSFHHVSLSEDTLFGALEEHRKNARCEIIMKKT